MEFRISLLLHNFFNDHRAACRVFITSKIKTIENLQQHIANTFDINSDFYLTCNNLYLPSSEDIRVLQENDSVTAIPCRQQANVADASYLKLNTDVCYANVEETINKTKKKKKSKRERKTTDEAETVDTTFDEKEKKSDSINCNNFEKVVDENFNFKQSKKKKNETNLNISDNTKALTGLHNGSCNLNNSSEESRGNNKESKFINAPRHLARNAFQTINELARRKKRIIQLMAISTQPKVIKSVKVYDQLRNNNKDFNVSNNCNEKPTELEQQRKDEETFEKPKNCFLQALEKVNNTVEPKKELQVSEENDSFSRDHSEVTPCITDDETSEIGSKGKRKRVRKRKRKAQNANDLLSIVPIVREVKPITTQAAPLIHIKFDDNEDVKIGSSVNVDETNLEVVDSLQNSNVNHELCTKVDDNKDVKMGNSDFQDGTEAKMDINTVNIDETNSEVVNSSQNSNVNYELCAEEIVKFPVMKYMFPKIRDVIAFKMLVFAEDYSPKLSNFIIGCILSCCEEKQTIFMQLLVGAEQCQLPVGKFSMETDDTDNIEVAADKKEFLWRDLIEPRLIFP